MNAFEIAAEYQFFRKEIMTDDDDKGGKNNGF